MKKKDFALHILLDESGELSPRRKRALEEALQREPELRAMRNQLHDTRQLMRTDDDELTVTPFTLERIQAEARRALGRPTAPAPARGFFAQWRPAVVYAALSVALLLFGTLFIMQFMHAPEPLPYVVITPDDELPWATAYEEWAAQFDEELAWLSDTLNGLHAEMDMGAWVEDDGQLDEWARELLELEDT